jgi:hypothetical protein
MTDDPTRKTAAALEMSEPWLPPAALSPPALLPSRPPALALALGLGIAVACGVGLWISSQALYIYILYNTLIGGALGWALGFAPKKSGFTNVPVLVGAGAALSVAPYVIMRFCLHLQFLPEFQAQGFDPSFVESFVYFLRVKTLFGIKIGLFGNVAVLLVEIGITIAAFYGKLQHGIAQARILSVPSDVVAFVVNGLAEGWDISRLRSELANRGWRQLEDQDRAIGTGFDVIASMQAQQA